MPKGAGALREKVAFDRKIETPDDLGGRDVSWSEIFVCAAEFIYKRGGESVEAGGLTGQATFKVRVRSSEVTRGLTSDDRLRDTRRDVIYNIREMDAVTDRANVWLVAESGVAS